MVRSDFLKSKTDEVTAALIDADTSELKLAVKKLLDHAIKLGGFGFGTNFLSWVASFSAIYLLILDRTNWRSNILTSLLVPYIFFSLPPSLFYFLRGQFGMWVAFVAVVLRLFFTRHFPGLCLRGDIPQFARAAMLYLKVISDWLEIPGSLILLLVVSPNLFARAFRSSWVGVAICLVIGCYLLQEHIRASGGFRNSFTQSHGISNTIGILLLFVYPMWRLITHSV